MGAVSSEKGCLEIPQEEQDPVVRRSERKVEKNCSGGGIEVGRYGSSYMHQWTVFLCVSV